MTLKGGHHTEEAKAKMSKARTGRVFSQAHKDAISAALKGKPSKLKGTKFTEEHKKNLRINGKGKNYGINSPRKRAVIINGVNYFSLAEAARQLDLPPASVCARVKSKTEKFSEWKYASAVTNNE